MLSNVCRCRSLEVDRGSERGDSSSLVEDLECPGLRLLTALWLVSRGETRDDDVASDDVWRRGRAKYGGSGKSDTSLDLPPSNGVRGALTIISGVGRVGGAVPTMPL